MKPQNRAELHKLAEAAGISKPAAPQAAANADVERLQQRVDTLENLLCDLSLHEDMYTCCFRKILKRELKAVKILEQ
jgi:hypothetical protein